MPEKLVGGYSMSDAQSWAATLISEIDSGSYSSQRSGWISSENINDVVDSTMIWASEANAYVCSTVMPNGYTVLESGDLDGSYYDSATPVIEIQIARGKLTKDTP
jgi:S1/P1 Nuclease